MKLGFLWRRKTSIRSTFFAVLCATLGSYTVCKNHWKRLILQQRTFVLKSRIFEFSHAKIESLKNNLLSNFTAFSNTVLLLQKKVATFQFLDLEDRRTGQVKFCAKSSVWTPKIKVKEQHTWGGLEMWGRKEIGCFLYWHLYFVQIVKNSIFLKIPLYLNFRAEKTFIFNLEFSWKSPILLR